jgi:hypothetical protein
VGTDLETAVSLERANLNITLPRLPRLLLCSAALGEVSASSECCAAGYWERLVRSKLRPT